jgi:phenylpropionate dioxygenase-like ring-hydroxylating dioxygenase large terminal subunit
MLHDPVLRNEWFAVARSSDVGAGRPVAARLLGMDVVLWRSADGVHAWQDLCIHRGAKLSLGTVKHDCLVCPYHAWEYAASGQCVLIPAQPNVPPPLKARANVFRACEKYGLVWVTVGEPQREPPEIAQLLDPEFRQLIGGPYTFHAQGPRILENFLDVGHLPIVHGGLLGDPALAEMPAYAVETTADGVIARDIAIWQPDPDGTGRPAKVMYTYQVHRPLIASFVKLHNGQTMFMAYLVTPTEEQHSMAWALFAMDYAKDVPAEEILGFQDVVIAQDKPVVESQRPELLPLDLREELHLRSDQTAMAYRRWLLELGMKYGTA